MTGRSTTARTPYRAMTRRASPGRNGGDMMGTTHRIARFITAAALVMGVIGTGGATAHADANACFTLDAAGPTDTWTKPLAHTDRIKVNAPLANTSYVVDIVWPSGTDTFSFIITTDATSKATVHMPTPAESGYPTLGIGVANIDVQENFVGHHDIVCTNTVNIAAGG